MEYLYQRRMQNRNLYLDVCRQRWIEISVQSKWIISSGLISCLQLIKVEASIISGHLYSDAFIRQLQYRTGEGGEEQAISMSFPRQEGSFQTRTVRITG